MTTDAAVTQWIVGLKAGEASAAERLWETYFPRLLGLARMKLAAAPRRFADEEDVALSAFKSFCLGAAQGRFPQLRDRDNLWPLLVVLTAHKAQDLLKHERRQKRGGGWVARGLSCNAAEADFGLEGLIGREPTPEFAAMIAENCECLLSRLEPAQRRIAQLKLEGYTSQEVAEQLGCGLRTVERRLELIRRTWDQAGKAT
jgi:DNA-directed RNA polymerase specialized sigma24 family protein